jgi:hypothetical protein
MTDTITSQDIDFPPGTFCIGMSWDKENTLYAKPIASKAILFLMEHCSYNNTHALFKIFNIVLYRVFKGHILR